ncbi:MAG TPA: hypothetical protein QF753_13990 [Victivallales bacterium]|mgnify:CR=1 FL=1|nr:hypothetical protein [Victivallales bacterium]|tara:strand:- start:363 stop:833 length:471 start_codon:yes stop_codon:yes gene_type:complete
MKSITEKLFEKAIELELKIGELYTLFSELFPQDACFWKELHEEESNHAFIIETAKEAMFTTGFSSKIMIPDDISSLETSINRVTELISEYNNNPTPCREKAFEQAIEIENSTGESHYEIAMSKATHSTALDIFQKLNNDDKNHAERIQKYYNLKLK